ncbi:hypothetical protein CEXT_414121 [Caerostris extrusa]|uniref:Uncharacterized protein n=1 Tax=Caerostris extrusa TaxID=172846 RepID=A0AAV4XX45_CAEEX|nr:hypothetical protein CEXT_414121 [Caerostris extrusa]
MCKERGATLTIKIEFAIRQTGNRPSFHHLVLTTDDFRLNQSNASTRLIRNPKHLSLSTGGAKLPFLCLETGFECGDWGLDRREGFGLSPELSYQIVSQWDGLPVLTEKPVVWLCLIW